MQNRKIEKRRLIPRWRSLARTPSNELASSNLIKSVDEAVGLTSALDDATLQWELRQTKATAYDLLVAELASGSTHFSQKAVALIGNENRVVSALEGIRQLRITRTARGTNIENLDDEHRRVSYLKRHLTEFNRDAISWCELALTYTRLGEVESARKCMRIARNIAPNNRYITRSHIRFASHINDDDERLQSVRKLQTDDPWIASAAYAVRETKGVFLPKRRVLEQMAQQSDASSASELAAGLATEEVLNGSRSRGRKLVDLSLVKPSDNTLAQMQWLEQNSTIELQMAHSLHLSYEARFSKFSANGSWQEAEAQGLEWIADEPFSTKAISEVIFNCLEYTRNYRLALELYSKLKRVSDDHSKPLIGLGPALAYEKEFTAARDAMKSVLSSDISMKDDPTFKFNEVVVEQLTKPDIVNSMRILELISSCRGNEQRSFRARAFLHWLRVLRVADSALSQDYEQAIINACKEETMPRGVRLLAKKMEVETQEKGRSKVERLTVNFGRSPEVIREITKDAGIT